MFEPRSPKWKENKRLILWIYYLASWINVSVVNLFYVLIFSHFWNIFNCFFIIPLCTNNFKKSNLKFSLKTENTEDDLPLKK